MKGKIIILVLTVVLVSCGLPMTGYKEYKPKEGEATAKINFISTVHANVSISMLNEARCDHSGFGYEAMALSTLFGLGKDIEVRADRRLYVRISGSQLAAIDHGVASYSACKTRFSFVPEKDGNYEITFSGTAEGCNANVVQIVATGNETQEIKDTSFQPECEGLYDKT